MRTDKLISRLSQQPLAVPRHAAARLLAEGLAIGAFVALAFTALVLGVRRDLSLAVTDGPYWMKFAYTMALAGAGFWTVERLSRPGARAGAQMALAALPVALVVLGAMLQWQTTPAPQHSALLFGHSHLACPGLIVVVSLPVFAGVLWSLRRLAPTRPVVAGAAAGLFAGASGAWIYTLHCDESSVVFVAVWYTLGIVLTGALGALIGRYVLRW